MPRIQSFFILLLLLMSSFTTNSQTLNELRKQKDKTVKDIKYTVKLLDEAGKSEKVTLNKLSLLDNKIKLQTSLICDINWELDILQELINDNTYVEKSLRIDLEQLRSNYADMIKNAWDSRKSQDKLAFLLSSNDFNQAYKRFLYLRQYSEYRRQQADAIIAVKGILDAKVKNLEKKKKEKELLLEGKRRETEQLLKTREKQGKLVKSLRKQQRDLKKKLAEKRKIEERIQKEIERVIKEEARKAAELAKAAGKEKPKSSEYAITPEDKALSGDFASNLGKLPWPVERGVITSRFGEHNHPVLKNIRIKNNGLDINTSKGSNARAVFRGIVSRVVGIPGGNMAVIVRHGEYLSVYSNLKKVFVKAGDILQIKQTIGEIFSDTSEGGKTVLKFQIWKQSTKLNPEFWISK